MPDGWLSTQIGLLWVFLLREQKVPDDRGGRGLPVLRVADQGFSQAVMPSFMGTTNSWPMQADRNVTRPPAGDDQAPGGW
jgi:hypothetical protein